MLFFVKNLGGDVVSIHTDSVSDIYKCLYQKYSRPFKLLTEDGDLTDDSLLQDGQLLYIYFIESEGTIRIYFDQVCYIRWGDPYVQRYQVRLSDSNTYHGQILFLFYEHKDRFYSSKDVSVLHSDPSGEDPEQIAILEDNYFDRIKDLFEDELSRIEDYSLRQYLLHKCLEDWRKNFAS